MKSHKGRSNALLIAWLISGCGAGADNTLDASQDATVTMPDAATLPIDSAPIPRSDARTAFHRPIAAGVGGQFVEFEANGKRSAAGVLTFGLIESGTTASCHQSWRFTADFEEPEGIVDGKLTGCNAQGESCKSVCPMAPGTGSCAARFTNLEIDPSSYVTDCILEAPEGWFHPNSGAVVLVEQLLFSTPIEVGVPTGTGMTWDEYYASKTGLMSRYAHHTRGYQVAIANRRGSGWNNTGFNLGITIITPDTGAHIILGLIGLQ